MPEPAPSSPPPAKPALTEDWLAVLIGFGLILLSAIGLLGPNGLKIIF